MAFSLFSTPQPQQTPQPFFQPQAQGFQQQSSPFFSQPQQHQSPFPQQTTPFQQPQFQPWQQQQQHPQPQPQQQQPQTQQQQQLYLFTDDKAPASYSTKWADLHPDSQKVLLQIEERILEYRDKSQRLDQCGRLYDSSVSNEGFEHDASRIVQELGGITTAMDRQKAVLHELMVVAKRMLRNAEIAIRSFMMLRPRFVHPKPSGAPSAPQPSQAPGATSTGQNTVTSIVPVSEFYRGLPKKPSLFLQQTVSRFEKYLSECRQWIEELEQLLILDSDKNSSNYTLLLQSLPKVMANVHDFFVHVAAKVENIHQYIESMRTAYLADQRRRGDGNDPFLEADRRETAKQEAAAKRTHPTLHLPLNSQPSTQVVGSFASSATPAASNAPQLTPAAPSASSGSGFSLFNTPSTTPSMSPSLFATPAPSAPLSLFGQPGASSQPSLFGSSSSGSLFGSSTPSLFGSSTPSLSSTPATGGALFSTPFASGAAMGSGASFGAASKSSRPKSRTARR